MQQKVRDTPEVQNFTFLAKVLYNTHKKSEFLDRKHLQLLKKFVMLYMKLTKKFLVKKIHNSGEHKISPKKTMIFQTPDHPIKK